MERYVIKLDLSDRAPFLRSDDKYWAGKTIMNDDTPTPYIVFKKIDKDISTFDSKKDANNKADALVAKYPTVLSASVEAL